MKTIRQDMLTLLQGEKMSARDLSQQLRISEREVYDHLDHIRKSAQSMGKKLTIDSARCLNCGFVFRERDRLTPPGHCPQCKHTHIEHPFYFIK